MIAMWRLMIKIRAGAFNFRVIVEWSIQEFQCRSSFLNSIGWLIRLFRYRLRKGCQPLKGWQPYNRVIFSKYNHPLIFNGQGLLQNLVKV